jgi:hypothetical protein
VADPTTPGRVFISYRRADAAATAGRLSDRIDARFGRGTAFMDVESIAPGTDFAEVIDAAVGSCTALVAVIGRTWSTAADEQGRRRLTLPDDFVAMEIASALSRDVPVIPVLIDGAPTPRTEDLPEALAPLAHRQCVRIDHDSFTSDVATLLAALEAARTDTSRPRRRSLWLSAGAVLVVLAIIVVFVVVRGMPANSGFPSRPVVPSTTAVATVACTDVADGAAFVQPQVTDSGRRSSLTFCPSRINGGKLPITGPFELTGQVLGPVADRKDLLLVTSGDPRTCDALGNPPTRGAFLVDQADMGGEDGRWSYTDHLGYDEAVTIGRHYEYVTGSPAALLAIRNTRASWEAANPGKAGEYPGILALPAEAQVLATFEVPAGVHQSAQPCR